jgi:hypothetical protein
VFLPQHHEAYIRQERWERNMAKISSNATRARTQKRSPGRGASLLAGLLRCHRCGRRLHVSYSKGVRYVCRGGALQRGEPTTRCFIFAGDRLEQHVQGLLLEVVCPAGVAAAERAAEQVMADRNCAQTRLRNSTRCAPPTRLSVMSETAEASVNPVRPFVVFILQTLIIAGDDLGDKQSGIQNDAWLEVFQSKGKSAA